jgi:hypothetical protein
MPEQILLLDFHATDPNPLFHTGASGSTKNMQHGLPAAEMIERKPSQLLRAASGQIATPPSSPILRNARLAGIKARCL